MTVRILQGDCRETLKTLADESVHAIVTSPPYWSLRDYGTPPLSWPAITYAPMPGLPPCVVVPAMTCSLGLEPTLEAFVGHIVQVFRELHRVLRADGTAWVNMGDSYVGNRGAVAWGPSEKARLGRVASRRRDNAEVPRSDVRVAGLKPKDMVGQPWRVAFALQADGWWLRSEVIWDKPNPMPESTKDRPTKAHEQLFLLSKSERYHFDHDAIKEAASPGTHPRKAVAGWANGGADHSSIAHAQTDKTRDKKLLNGVGWGYGDQDAKERTRGVASHEAQPMRAKRSVWRIPTEGVPEAHFATFPQALVEPCVRASCPLGGTVLDPFGGSGTVGLVADRLGRNALLCELSAEYVGISRGRVTRAVPLFADVLFQQGDHQ